MLLKGPGAIGKPLARSAEREPLPYGFPQLSVRNQKNPHTLWINLWKVWKTFTNCKEFCTFGRIPCG